MDRKDLQTTKLSQSPGSSPLVVGPRNTGRRRKGRRVQEGEGAAGETPMQFCACGTGEDGAAKVALTADSHAAHFGGH